MEEKDKRKLELLARRAHTLYQDTLKLIADMNTSNIGLENPSQRATVAANHLSHVSDILTAYFWSQAK